MDRRRFLAASGAGASSLLTGCVTTQGENPLAQISGSAVIQGLGLDANREAFSAYSAIYAEMQRSQDPLTVRLPGMSQAANGRVASANQFLDGLPETLSDLQLAQAWRQIEPFISPLNRSTSQSGAAQAQSGRSVSGLGQNVRAENRYRVSRTTLLPGQTLRAVMRGHCADKTLPAFYTGLPLTLHPAEAFVAGDRWGRMQLALLDYFSENPEAVRTSDQQFILWGLQGKDVNGSPYYFQALLQRPDLLNIVNQAVPGALVEIQRAQAIDELNRHLQQMLQRSLPPEVRELMGNASIIQALANPAEAPRLIEAELERMEQMARNNPQPQPGPEAAFSTLAPQVFAHSVGMGHLGAMVTMTNLSDSPFEFQPSRWMAETKTNHLRGMFTQAETVRIWDHVFDTSLSGPERVLAAIGTVPGVGNLARLSVSGGRGVATVARWAIENRGARFLATVRYASHAGTPRDAGSMTSNPPKCNESNRLNHNRCGGKKTATKTTRIRHPKLCDV